MFCRKNTHTNTYVRKAVINFIMDKYKPGRDTPFSPDARIPIPNCVKTTPSRNEMGLAFYCQYDNIARHWPNTIPTATCVECQRPTEVHCIQCAAPLCIKSNGDANIFINCYINFHTPPKGKNIILPNFLPDQNDSDSETDQEISQKNI